jgi:hypothetical protein
VVRIGFFIVTGIVIKGRGRRRHREGPKRGRLGASRLGVVPFLLHHFLLFS